LGGSWYLEELTDEMERRAEQIFTEIMEMGSGSMLDGCINGIEENWFQGKIADSAYELERSFNSGQRIVVGVNRFQEGNNEADLEILRITNEDELKQRRRLEAVRATRDTAKIDMVLARLETEASDPTINLMPTLIEASNNRVTIGEMMKAMGNVFGRHIEIPTI
jgi:methylmalonyl-CoA mutase N-terminal domain/subunit